MQVHISDNELARMLQVLSLKSIVCYKYTLDDIRVVPLGTHPSLSKRSS